MSKLRETISCDKQVRESLEQRCEASKCQLTEASNAARQLSADNAKLEARLATADSKIRELDRNWSRESLGVSLSHVCSVVVTMHVFVEVKRCCEIVLLIR